MSIKFAKMTSELPASGGRAKRISLREARPGYGLSQPDFQALRADRVPTTAGPLASATGLAYIIRGHRRRLSPHYRSLSGGSVQPSPYRSR